MLGIIPSVPWHYKRIHSGKCVHYVGVMVKSIVSAKYNKSVSCCFHGGWRLRDANLEPYFTSLFHTFTDKYYLSSLEYYDNLPFRVIVLRLQNEFLNQEPLISHLKKYNKSVSCCSHGGWRLRDANLEPYFTFLFHTFTDKYYLSSLEYYDNLPFKVIVLTLYNGFLIQKPLMSHLQNITNQFRVALMAAGGQGTLTSPFKMTYPVGLPDMVYPVPRQSLSTLY